MDANKSKSGWGANLLIFVVMIFICLIVAEVILRIAWRGYQPLPQSESMMTYDDTLGWVGKPNYDGWLRESRMTVSCQTNEWGFRDDPPLPVSQIQHKRRLMFLGDSFVMGTGIEKNERASEVIERLDSTLVCYNFGIFGYSTDQELLALQKFGQRIQPDDVLLFFCANDLVYNDSDFGHRTPKPHFYLDDNGTLKAGNVPVPTTPEPNPVTTWFNDRLAIGQLTDRIIARIDYKNQPKSRSKRTDPELNEVAEDTTVDYLLINSDSLEISDLTFHILKAVRDECRRQGTNLTLITTPSSRQWTETRDETPQEIKKVLAWCEELDIKAIDLFPLFYSDYLENGEALFLPDNSHWNAEGNRLAAEIILKHLDETDNSIGIE